MPKKLTKKQRTSLEKEIDSRWDEVLGMKGFNPFVFLPDDIKSKLRKEYIRVIKEIVFIKKAKIKHKGKYDYSEVYYVNIDTKIKIWCSKHGDFWQRPHNHLNGKQGCPKCGLEKQIKKRTKTLEQFEKEANEKHNHKYRYFGDYVNAKTEIKIWCKKHKYYFWQRSNDHLQGKGCPKCAGKGFSTKEWVDRFREVHGDRYSYDRFVYKGNDIKSVVTCPKHSDFLITPSSHLHQKQGCPKCKQSKGETQIENYLNNNKIKYETQKRFDDCKHKKQLPFDFYLPDHDLLIEFQGVQHYQVKEHFGGEEGYKQIKKNDQIKRKFCSKRENPDLLEIKYKMVDDEEYFYYYLNHYLRIKKEKLNG